MLNVYEKYLLPRLLNCLCSAKPVRYQREKVVPGAQGVVLEVGIGSGLNIPFYNVAKVERVIGLDPSVELNALARCVAAEHCVPVELMLGDAQAIALAENSVDTVLVTYTLCTIPDALSACREMLRVLKPNGRLIFCEHGIAPDVSVARWQARIDPLWGLLAGGCHLNRDIPRLLTDAGFELQNLEQMYLPSTPRFAGYNFWGSAQIGGHL